MFSFRYLKSLMPAVLLLSGCAATGAYVYQPATTSTGRVGELPATSYTIPTGQPTGEVRVASYGVTEIEPQAGGQRARVLQVRFFVQNNRDAAGWTVDTRQILVRIAGAGQSRPALVNSDLGTPPVLQVSSGRRGVIDLFYPLPPNLEEEGQLPSFEVSWRVQTGSGIIARRTPFQRERIDQDQYAGSYPGYDYPESRASVGLYLGYAPYWWYDPYYPRITFYHSPRIVIGPGPYRVYPHYHHGYRYRGYYGPGYRTYRQPYYRSGRGYYRRR